MSNREAQTEILVHITAPSRASDDKSYRALASAYLDFEPAQRHELPTLTRKRQLEETEEDKENEENEGVQAQDQTHSSWCAPPSVIADSNPDNDISIAALCSPTRILEHFLQTIDSSYRSSQEIQLGIGDGLRIHRSERDSSSQSSRPGVVISEGPSSSFDGILNTPCPATRQAKPVEGRPLRFSADQAIEDSFYGEEIPCTQRLQVDVDEAPDVVVIPATPRAGSEPPVSKRLKRSPAKETVQSLERSASGVLPRGSRSSYEAHMREIRKSPHTKNLEINAPLPSVGCEGVQADSLITVKLAKLAKDLELPKRFRPKQQLREMRPFERGYWLVDCSDWDTDLKERAWAFLGNYVAIGDAGWGVSCIRDASFSWIRLYCWGHVVGHMYLVLYMVSERKLPYQWTFWHDASGKVQIVAGLKAE